MNVMVAGGTGFVGKPLVDALVSRGDAVTVVTRDPPRAKRNGRQDVSYRGWLPELDVYDAAINLTGEPIFGRRWNDEVRTRIQESRVQSTRTMVKAIRAADDPPDVFVNASAIGYYGDRGDEELTEDSAPGSDFMARVCKAWEEAARDAPVRTVLLRTGVVLGPDGGALEQMLPPFKLGLGGPIGSGRQHFSWIHLDDLVGLVLHALDEPGLAGPVNATAPGVVTNKEFTRALGRVLRRPTLLPVPPFALRLRFGEVADVLTASARCLPRAAQVAGFDFRFPEVEAALRDVLGR